MGFELPEVLKLAEQMETVLKGKTIQDIVLDDRCSSLIKQGMCNLDRRKDEVVGSLITAIQAKGKWIFLIGDNGRRLLFGEMIGKLLYHAAPQDIPENYHVLFQFTDQSSLTFHSALYAFLEVADEEQVRMHKYAGAIGVSPLDAGFTLDYLGEVIARNQSKAMKALLNLQHEIAGLGNVYINDILFEAQIHPKRKAVDLSEAEVERLYRAIVCTARTAVESGGCVDECDLYGNPGRYVRKMDKAQAGTPCPRCGAAIEKVAVLGSACYICTQCQK